MPKTVSPDLGLESYSCPHCGALAHQSWYRVFIDVFADNNGPELYDVEHINKAGIARIEDPNERKRIEQFVDRLEGNIVTFRKIAPSLYVSSEMANLHLGRCYSCRAFSIWVKGLLRYPDHEHSFVPHADMPADVKSDFEEAASIYSKSPRGAAALLRLAIQKLMPHVGEKGKNINDDIASLVSKGLDPVIQKALDVVRVVGNNAVHPGQIDLKDDPTVASKLFGLVNVIVTTMISAKRQIAEMFDGLPEEAKAAIEKRDKKTPASTTSPAKP